MTRKNDPVKSREAQKRWRSAHPEKVREINRLKYLARREDAIERQRCYVRKNAERVKAYKAWYAKTPKGKALRSSYENKRRALKRGVDGIASAQAVKTLLLSAASCAYCRSPFTTLLPATLDHKTALSRGGAHSIDNLTAACGPCNSRKGAKDHKEFIAMISSWDFT